MEGRAVVEHFAGEIAVEVIRVCPVLFTHALGDDLRHGVVGVLRVTDFHDIAAGVVLIVDAVAIDQVAFFIARVGGERVAVDRDGAHLVALPGVGEGLSANGVGGYIAGRISFDGDGCPVLVGEPGQVAMGVVLAGETLDGVLTDGRYQ